MKVTTRFLYLDVLLLAIALAVAAFAFVTEIHEAAEKSAIKEQDQHLKTLWKLLKAKGQDIRIAGGKLQVGNYTVNDSNELPDHLRDIFGCTATIFMGDTRISTNVLKPDGNRAVGTRLQGPAYDAIFRQGKPYRGEALILGIPYLTAYDPIRNGKGEIIGALYVGVKKSDYFATYENLKIKVIILTTILMLLFSTLAFLLIKFRRKAGDALEESEVKFRKLFELQSDAILMVDRNTGEILEANASAFDLYGFARKELLAKTCYQLSTEPDKIRASIEEGKHHIPVSRHMKKDGTIFPVEIFNSFFTWKERRVLIAAIRDITERKKAEESMSRLNRTLRTLTKCNEMLVRAENESNLLHDICRVIIEDGGYRFAWVGYAEYDEARSVRPVAHAGHEEGYLEKLNISWSETETGMGPTGIAIRTGLPSYVKDIDQDPAFAIWRDEAGKRGYRSSLAIPFISSEQIGSLNIYASETDAFDAEEIELMAQLANDLAYGIKSLRTREKHRQTAEALWESVEEYRKLAVERDKERNLLRALIDSIPDLIFFKDHASIYLGCNKAFESFAGRPEKNLIGLTDLDMFPREVGEFFREMDQQMMTQRIVQRNEEWVDYPDGRHVLLETLKTPFYDRDGNILGLIGISRDITERHRAKEEREKLEAQLLQAQKMEAIGQLAGGIAHDFNNILTAIIGYSEIISMRIGKDSPLRHFIEQILTSSGRAADLVNGLLAFSRKQVLHPKPVDLCEIVQGLKKMLGRIIREDIDFRTTVYENELVVMADKGQIEQVLMNFVTNAKDAMPQGGALSIEVSPAFMDSGFVHAHGFGEPGYYACISVADTGCGMDDETQKKMFEPFYTTKEVGKGTGLGMAIIYGIVKQHHGYINVYSEPGRGTTFRVYLPLLAEEKNEAQDTLNTEHVKGGTETILLVEDDRTVRELHRMILEEAGYTIIEAIDGQDALAKFMKHQCEVDILATDVIMPKIDGKRLFKEIQGFRPAIKVLFISGYTKDILIERGILDDESSFISKPVMSSELLIKVRNILDRDK
jgi:PAS domain S-box-containing protein